MSIAKHQHNATDIGGIRQRIATSATNIDYASRLRSFFRSLIFGALDELKNCSPAIATALSIPLIVILVLFGIKCIRSTPALETEGSV